MALSLRPAAPESAGRASARAEAWPGSGMPIATPVGIGRTSPADPPRSASFERVGTPRVHDAVEPRPARIPGRVRPAIFAASGQRDQKPAHPLRAAMHPFPSSARWPVRSQTRRTSATEEPTKGSGDTESKAMSLTNRADRCCMARPDVPHCSSRDPASITRSYAGHPV